MNQRNSSGFSVGKALAVGAFGLLTAAFVALLFTTADAQWRRDRDRDRDRDHKRYAGDVITENRDASDFDAIVIKGIADVDVTQGDNFAVEVRAPQDLIEYVVTKVRGGVLYVGFDDDEFDFFDHIDISDEELNISVTLPALKEITVKGIGSVTMDRFTGDELEIELSGVGDVNIKEFIGRAMTIELDGVGNLEIGGEVDELDVDLNGIGDADLRDLKAKRVIADVDGMGDLEVFASESIEAHASGFGDVIYYGNPDKVRRRAKGFGDVYAGR
ncbi:MAG TPA: head GIN domain-containing protein [candidate division Zixibacteria bacterium]|nr:head GIN domain-containing protein [candidate division Zixibacteria bacterium]